MASKEKTAIVLQFSVGSAHRTREHEEEAPARMTDHSQHTSDSSQGLVLGCELALELRPGRSTKRLSRLEMDLARLNLD
ncbi:hypothetical protein PanWU01x14_240860 [Parasponia andersonii]|uniref:Uncharacterized protein n=1 Tax=Parasponia andersonii TaxID=3476 RepID=A0A2P5BGK3_PARAD|nr:hypothetical protein PanWU01x14_240860 [Parasponia andersonii]